MCPYVFGPLFAADKAPQAPVQPGSRGPGERDPTSSSCSFAQETSPTTAEIRNTSGKQIQAK